MPEAAGLNTSVGSRQPEHFRRHTFVWKPPARTFPSAHSHLVAGAADTKVSYRNQVPASANSRGSVQSGVIVRASVVRDYVGDSAARVQGKIFRGYTREHEKTVSA